MVSKVNISGGISATELLYLRLTGTSPIGPNYSVRKYDYYLLVLDRYCVCNYWMTILWTTLAETFFRIF